MPRTILVGDVHGCADELDALLERVAVAPADRLVFVGDLVVRGPYPQRVLATLRALGASAVRGNHEDRLLRLRSRGLSDALPTELARTAELFDEDDWRFLAALPLWLALPENGLVVVHAGLVPGVAIEAQEPRHLLHLRCIDAHGRPSERRDDGTPWGALYVGPPHVVFGHNALPEAQIHPWATGIDTGCVYGRALTALVLDQGEPVPAAAAARRARLVSEPARRAYASIG